MFIYQAWNKQKVEVERRKQMTTLWVENLWHSCHKCHGQCQSVHGWNLGWAYLVILKDGLNLSAYTEVYLT